MNSKWQVHERMEQRWHLNINPSTPWQVLLVFLPILFLPLQATRAALIFETTSPYHHIRVLQDGDLRTLCFDDATESRMSVSNPSQGHFEYTEYFHMAWLWNTQLTSVAMIGLGGGSTQRAFEHYYPNLTIETAEIDPGVVDVARRFFKFEESNVCSCAAAPLNAT
jgi:spermidine synthase